MGRRHAAIIFTDIVGYTALMGSDEDRAFEILHKNREIHSECIAQFNGTLIKEMGDGMLISFNLASDAVRCAIEIQKASKEKNIPLKIGIHEGEMVFEGNDVHGDGVNIASRLQDNTKEGCITISGSVYRDIRNKSDIKTEFIGEKSFKNVDEPIKVYEVKCDEIHQKNISPLIPKQNAYEKKSIIVLPFVNMSPDPDQEFFSDGLTEEIITDLSHIKDLLVISRSSAMTFKSTGKTIKEIATKVNVRFVLEGSVRKAGNNLRITAQLIDASTDTHLWAEKYNGTLDDVFDIQEKVSRSITDSLKIKLKTEERNTLANRPIVNIQIYECLLRAKNDIYSYTKEGLDNGIKTLQTGLDILGENELLYASLGEAYYLFFDFGFETDKAILKKVEEYAKKTLALNHDSGYGYKLLALLERGGGSLQKTCHYIKKAYDAEPNDSSIQLYAAGLLGIYADKRSFAIAVFDNLLKIDPLSPVNYLFYGFYLIVIGHYDKAVEFVTKSFQLSPDFIMSKFWLANILAAKKQNDKALKTIDEALCIKGIDQLFKELLLFLKYIILGEKEKALKTFSKKTKTYLWNDPDFSFFMTGYYAMLDEKEMTYMWMEHALDRDFINYTYWSSFPFLENMRGEKQFKALLERVKYEWDNFEI